MATKKRATPYKYRNTQTDRSVDFADIVLKESDASAFKGWCDSVEEAFADTLIFAINDGWKVSFKYDSANVCHLCSWTQSRHDHINDNMVVTSRAGTPEEAFLLNFYKVFVLYDGQRLPTRMIDYTWG